MYHCSSVVLLYLYYRSTASWPVEPPADETEGWRYFRVKQNGKNANGHTHYLSLSGFEIYGEVKGVSDKDLGEVTTVGHDVIIRCREGSKGG